MAVAEQEEEDTEEWQSNILSVRMNPREICQGAAVQRGYGTEARNQIRKEGYYIERERRWEENGAHSRCSVLELE